MDATQIPLIGEILSRLDAVEVEPSTTNIESNQHVVGEMPEELQHLASLRNQLHREYETAVDEANAQLETISDRDERQREKKRLEGETDILKDKACVVSGLFRLSLCLAFPELVGKRTIGYANGFQIYWEEQEDRGLCDCLFCSASRGEDGVTEVFVAMPATTARGAYGLGLLGLLGSLAARLHEQTPDEPATDEPPESDGEQ